jgi:hypothetical protein
VHRQGNLKSVSIYWHPHNFLFVGLCSDLDPLFSVLPLNSSLGSWPISPFGTWSFLLGITVYDFIAGTVVRFKD